MRRANRELRCAAATVVLLLLSASGARAQVDPSGDWRTWRTEHFRIHAHAEDAAVALRAAHEAERAYALLATELRPPRGILDIVVADNVDFSDGFASVYPSNRLTIYARPPTRATSILYYDSWLRLVLVHELAHLFHLDRADGVWGVLQTVFGRAPGLFPNAYQSSWVTEGLATYYESRFSNAGRVTGSYHRELLTAAARDQRWVRDIDATRASPAWPGGNRAYAWGTEFLVQEAGLFGDTLVPRFVDNTSKQIWPFAVSGALRAAGGEGVDAGWDRLHEVARSLPAAASGAQILDRGLRVEPQPSLDPGGTRLAYVRRDGKSETHVVVRSLATGDELATRRVNAQPEIAWVGDTLYVAQLDYRSPVDLVSDLYRWEPDGRWERITTGARLAAPFAAPGGGVGAVDLAAGARRLVRVRDGEVEELPAPPADAFSGVALSPDGGWLAAARQFDGRWDIVLWPAGDPADVRAVTADAALDRDPVWTADGARLLFTSERLGFPQISAYEPAGGAVTRLTAEPTGARQAALTPGGALIYSTQFADGYALVRLASPRTLNDPGAPGPVRRFEPAPEVAVDSGGYRPWPALRPHHWLPLIHGEGATGTFWGAATAGVDPIGRTRYVAAASAAADPFRGELAVSAEHARWKYAALDGGFAQRWDGGLAITSDGDTVGLGERERLGEVGLRMRWRRWRSSLVTRLGVGLEQTSYFNEAAGGTLLFQGSTFLTGVLAVQAGYAQRPAMAISRENGVQLEALYRHRVAVSPGDTAWSYEVRAGANGFLALGLPGFANWVLAARVTEGRTGGPAPDRFAVGGESGDLFEFLPGYFLGSGRRAFPLRGYPRSPSLFTHAFTAIAELRIPVVVVNSGIWKLPFVLDRLSFSVFGEMGGGWLEGEASARDALRDVGGELVSDWGFLYDTPVRLRFGVAVPLTDGPGVSAGSPRGYVAFGSTF